MLDNFTVEVIHQPVGTVIEYIATEENKIEEIVFWLGKIDQEFLGVIEESGFWRIYVKKVKAL